MEQWVVDLEAQDIRINRKWFYEIVIYYLNKKSLEKSKIDGLFGLTKGPWNKKII